MFYSDYSELSNEQMSTGQAIKIDMVDLWKQDTITVPVYSKGMYTKETLKANMVGCLMVSVSV